MQRGMGVCRWAVVLVLVLSCVVAGAAQVNTATLSGTVTDPQGLAVRGAKVTVISATTGAERSIVADEDGRYTFIGLTPGRYKMSVDGGANFGVSQNYSVVVTVGEDATFNARLNLKGVTETVMVTTETAAIEMSKTEVSQTVGQRRIENLPINGRGYINFTLINSQTTRDVSPTIGPAPNSGLNMGGARARSNMVSVDGADAVDNSVNGIRATVSQEAVQEFQLILSNYNAEYGRATGGVINIVTKSGANDLHGDVFGFFRNKSFQARNPFSGQVNPTTGNLDPVKQAYTRVQSGFTFGGPLKKDKTFYFLSYEYTQRQESGFSSIGLGNYGLTVGSVPCIPVPLSLTGGPTGQLAFYQAALGQLTGNGAACNNPNPAIQAQINGVEQAAILTGASSNVALNADLNKNADGSRTGLTQSRDLNITFQHDTVISDRDFNEARFQYARRGLHFGFSQLPGGSNIGVNIPGVAYFGREPYSTVDRIERRTEFTDQVSLIRGKHTFKFGGDYNLIQLRSSKAQIFELDFGGDVNFGGLTPFGSSLPGTNGLQSYGLGIPITYIQGIGNSNQPFDNIPMGFFAQDSWKLTRKLIVNYGVRYDVEISPLFSPATAVNAAAEQALGVVEGIPRNYKNVAPRFGLAWDPAGNGKTVIRAGYGLFYDHPLLATAFDSVTADGGRSVQLLSAGGRATACGLLPAAAAPPGYPTCGGGADIPTNLNGASIFQGVLNALPNMFSLPDQQRFDPLASGSLFANQNYLTAGFPLPVLPFTLPIARNFKYGYAQQANLTIEREIAGSWKFSLGYQWSRGLHLHRPVDV